MLDLNQRPPACEAGALPTELIDRDEGFYVVGDTASTEREATAHDASRNTLAPASGLIGSSGGGAVRHVDHSVQ